MELSYISNRYQELNIGFNKYFDLTNIDGQTRSVASLSSLVNGAADGDSVINVQAQARTIILDLRIRQDVDVEEAKRAVTEIIKIKQFGLLRWRQNNRTVTIQTIVESIEMPRWTNAVLMQITFHCPEAFWEDAQEIINEISEIIDEHYFTDLPNNQLYFPSNGIMFGRYDMSRSRTFHNSGDVAVGMDIIIHAISTVTNPIIYDTDGNFFGIGYGTGSKKLVLSAGDVVKITTHRGNKTVKLADGTNLYNKIKPSSTWLQLQTGDNQFTINSDDVDVDNMLFYLAYKQRYV